MGTLGRAHQQGGHAPLSEEYDRLLARLDEDERSELTELRLEVVQLRASNNRLIRLVNVLLTVVGRENDHVS